MVSTLFDDLVGASENCWRHFEAKSLCGFAIDDQFVFEEPPYPARLTSSAAPSRLTSNTLSLKPGQLTLLPSRSRNT